MLPSPIRPGVGEGPSLQTRRRHELGSSLRVRETRRVRKGFTASAAVVSIVLLTGCSGVTVQGAVPTPAATQARTPTPRAETPTATPTEERVFVEGPLPVAYRTQEGAGTWQVRRYSWQRTANGEEAAPPEDSYLILDVLMTATEGTVQVNPLYFSVRTRGGDVGSSLGADGNEPVLASRQLAAGESIDGIVSFDVPRADTTVTLVDELGNQAAQIEIPAP